MTARALSCEQLRLVDKLAVEAFSIPSIVLMENAGRGAADFIEKHGVVGSVIIACGPGNNGGDGLVLARHLDGRGHDVRVFFWASPERLTGDARTNYEIAVRSSIPIEHRPNGPWTALALSLAKSEWIVDALLGTGAKGALREPMASDVLMLNQTPARRLALDVPTGLNADEGTAAGVAFEAHDTITFAAAKTGFARRDSFRHTGTVHVADIGLPAAIWKRSEFAGQSSE